MSAGSMDFNGFLSVGGKKMVERQVKVCHFCTLQTHKLSEEEDPRTFCYQTLGFMPRSEFCIETV